MDFTQETPMFGFGVTTIIALLRNFANDLTYLTIYDSVKINKATSILEDFHRKMYYLINQYFIRFYSINHSIVR